MPDRQHQPMPSRNTSRGVADKAGVGDLVELLVCMDVTATGLKTSSRVAQLQGMRQKPQALAGKSSMPQRSVSCSGGPELRLSVPPPVPPAARQSTKLERASLASVSALSRRHPVPHPDRATTSSSKQSQVLLSALRTPPELRRGIR
ncbi:hypothetical protein GGI04_001439 [Coemansia thaxteri]|uniref:Uncharacterized protein n=1 Tax=Coemansia thaxteri TaxID=2663907 RepID=A0A9W8BNK0_9FUNG|nr:hypothetical protein H4R26_001102 [Coemansia thaxteri]KAJ2007652.1 hypothetical protein GGI04_001439 [Coemansia thaxteri]KAJ2471248.1 hypothetical protein GGI02_002393 [Coemansia sp. RSA 2322]KAJ2484665.1 hypothetical protein EV174_002252 [Coemansia sp. RSA 2320]